jgi:hypothetical protein
MLARVFSACLAGVEAAPAIKTTSSASPVRLSSKART